jgi:hypothetical protein
MALIMDAPQRRGNTPETPGSAPATAEQADHLGLRGQPPPA